MPKNKSVYISKEQVDEALSHDPQEGKRLLEPLKSIWQSKGSPINILEDHKVSNDAEVHRHEGDLWICLEGEVSFTVGGKMVDPELGKKADGSDHDLEVKAASIEGGEEHTMRKGDILWILAGEPHAHKTDLTARLFIIKVPAREVVPLSEVPGWKN